MTASPPPTDTERLAEALVGPGFRDQLAVVLDGEYGSDAALLDALVPVVQEHAARRAAEALNRLAHDLLNRQEKTIIRAARELADAGDTDAWLRDVGRAAGYGTSAHLARVAAAALAAAHPDHEQQP